MKRFLVIRDLTRAGIVAERAELARGVVDRVVGLLARRGLEDGEGLVIPRCRAIHTCFMRFAIDVLFVRTAGLPAERARLPAATSCVAVKIVHALAPFRFAWARGADTVIELPPGRLARSGLGVGHRVDISPSARVEPLVA